MDRHQPRAARTVSGLDPKTRRRLIRAGAVVAPAAAYVVPSMRTLEVAEAACNVSSGLDVEVAGCGASNGQISGHIRLDNCFPVPLKIDSVQLSVGGGAVGPSLNGKHDQGCELLQAGQMVPAKGCATVRFTATVSSSSTGTIVASATVCGTPQGGTQQWCGNGGAAIGVCAN